jgi:hypothetical protein
MATELDTESGIVRAPTGTSTAERVHPPATGAAA